MEIVFPQFRKVCTNAGKHAHFRGGQREFFEIDRGKCARMPENMHTFGGGRGISLELMGESVHECWKTCTLSGGGSQPYTAARQKWIRAETPNTPETRITPESPNTRNIKEGRPHKERPSS